MKLPKDFGELTVREFQQVSKIMDSEDDLLDKYVNVIACLSGKDIKEIESNTFGKIGEWFKQVSFIQRPYAPENYSKWVFVNGRFYKPVVNNENFLASQLISLKFLDEKKQPIELLNQLLACCYVRMNWLGKPLPYNAKDHNQIAEDMLDVKLKHVYGFLMFKKKVLLLKKSTTPDIP